MFSKQTPTLDHRWIDPEAYQIVKTLQKRGYTTYLVGGCVRDLLLGKHPKDFDIATNARPNEVRNNLRNAFVIGKRFRLVLVKRGDQQYEVSTFRRDPKQEEINDDGPPSDNLFGSPEEDAKRRDFTINSLFYDPVGRELIDYAEGMVDLQAGIVRMIGDPDVRLTEDPIRIMRGIRLAHMIDFSIEANLRRAMKDHAAKLVATPLPRRREEFLKYLRLDNPAMAFVTSLDLGVLQQIAPTITALFENHEIADLLHSQLSHFHDTQLESPVELIAAFVLAYLLAERSGDLPEEIHVREFEENEALNRLMGLELGAFKSEQLQIARAFHLLYIFRRREMFEKRGERRRAAVIANDAFPLTLKLAERIPWLVAPRDLAYWQEQAEKYKDQPRPTRRRRRRRPPRRGAQNGSDSTSTSDSGAGDDTHEEQS